MQTSAADSLTSKQEHNINITVNITINSLTLTSRINISTSWAYLIELGWILYCSCGFTDEGQLCRAFSWCVVKKICRIPPQDTFSIVFPSDRQYRQWHFCMYVFKEVLQELRVLHKKCSQFHFHWDNRLFYLHHPIFIGSEIKRGQTLAINLFQEDRGGGKRT